MKIKYVEAYDPGITTGAAYFVIGEDSPLKLEYCEEIPKGVNGFIRRKLYEGDIVIAEQFVLDGRTVRPELEPLRIEGVLIADAYALGFDLIFQRNNFKAHVTDDKLKEIGWYQKGMPHANDAIRHGLAWAKTSGHLPTLQAYFK